MNKLWGVVNGKIDAAIKEDGMNPTLLIGGKDNGFAIRLNGYALYDEFIQGNYWRELPVDQEANPTVQFSQFRDCITSGITFGDYQQFATLADRLEELSEEANKLQAKGLSPAELLEPAYDAVRVRCAGHTEAVSIKGYNHNYCELVELLEEIDQLIWDNK